MSTLRGKTGLRDALGHIKRARVRIVVQATEITEDAAKEEAPVLSGRLRAEIDHTLGQGSTTGAVQSATPYAAYVEGGTRYQAANPYMSRALRRARVQAEHEAVAIMKQELKL